MSILYFFSLVNKKKISRSDGFSMYTMVGSRLLSSVGMFLWTHSQRADILIPVILGSATVLPPWV